MPDFSLVQTPNYATAALGGYTAGLAMGRQKRTQAALDMMQNDPEGGIHALGSVDPELAAQLQQNQDAVNARNLRAAAIGSIGQPAPQALGAPQQPMGAPMDGAAPAMPEIGGGAAPAPQSPPMQMDMNNPHVQALFVQDPKAATELVNFAQKATEQQRAQLKESQDALAAVGAHLQTLPYEQRKQELMRLAPELAAHGVTQQMITGFDPTDQVIGATVAQALGVKGILEQRDKEFQRQDKQADNARLDQGLALQARGQDITLRGQNMTDARSRETNGITGKAPSGYAYLPDGTLHYIAGGPADPAQRESMLRPIPATAVTGIQGNTEALRKLDYASTALDEYPDAVGFKAYTPDAILQRSDPNGTKARAAIAEIGAVKIHDLSGAAVSASEAPRFQPFVPKPTDSAATIKHKLDGFKSALRAQLDEQNGFYSPDNGYKPYSSASTKAAAGGGPKVIRYNKDGKRIG